MTDEDVAAEIARRVPLSRHAFENTNRVALALEIASAISAAREEGVMAERERLLGMDASWRRYTFPDGEFDELVLPCATVHFERLNDFTIWFGFSEPGRAHHERVSGAIHSVSGRAKVTLTPQDTPNDLPIREGETDD